MQNTVAVALGTFDGLHKAHIAVLMSALNQNTDKKICITFPYPPKMTDSEPQLLLAPEEKEKMLKTMGFDEVINLDFNKVKTLTPTEFLDYLVSEFGATHISVGYNYRFGSSASGDTEFLKDYCQKHGLHAVITDGIKIADEVVSSSAIRHYLKTGNTTNATEFLGRNFKFTAKVISGDKRGRTIGVPTVNQMLPKGLVKVKFGVYYSLVNIDGKKYKAVTNIGYRPTYELETPISETHIIGFSGDLYEKQLSVELVEFLREERKFENLQALKNAVQKDIEYVKSHKR